jgi:hypothetical protein
MLRSLDRDKCNKRSRCQQSRYWRLRAAPRAAVEDAKTDRGAARPLWVRLAWLAQDDYPALDQACDVCLSYTEVDLGIRGRAIGLLARAQYGDFTPCL